MPSSRSSADVTAHWPMAPIGSNVFVKTPTASGQPFTPNPGLYTNGKHELYLSESPSLAPQEHECVVHVRSSGICGSDIHFWKAGRIGSLKVNEDYILGHESAGVIVQVGAAVSHLKIGDRVAIEPGVPCEKCYQCSIGKYNLCGDVRFAGAPAYHGTIRRYHVHPAKYLHKLPDHMSFTEGALLEPLSVVMHGVERSPLQLGEPTVICGAGPIGLVALAAVRASGAHPVVVTDVDPRRLAFAAQFVPQCRTILVQPEKSPEEMAAVIHEALSVAGGHAPRVVYECTGVESSINTAINTAQTGGEVMVIGVGRDTINQVPFMHASLAEIDLKFINRYHHSWPRAIRALSAGIIDLKPLVTHRYRLEEAVAALTCATNRGEGAIKIHIEDSFGATNGAS